MFVIINEIITYRLYNTVENEKLADVEILCVVIQCHIKLVPIVKFHEFGLVFIFLGIIFVVDMIHGDFELGATGVFSIKNSKLSFRYEDKWS